MPYRLNFFKTSNIYLKCPLFENEFKCRICGENPLFIGTKYCLNHLNLNFKLKKIKSSLRGERHSGLWPLLSLSTNAGLQGMVYTASGNKIIRPSSETVPRVVYKNGDHILHFECDFKIFSKNTKDNCEAVDDRTGRRDGTGSSKNQEQIKLMCLCQKSPRPNANLKISLTRNQKPIVILEAIDTIYEGQEITLKHV